MKKSLKELIEQGNYFKSKNKEYPNDRLNTWRFLTETALRKEDIESDILQRFLNSTSFLEQLSIAKEVYEKKYRNPFMTIQMAPPSIVNNNNNVFNPSVNVDLQQIQTITLSIEIRNEIIIKIDNSALQLPQKEELKALINEIEAESKQVKPRWEKVLEGIQKVIKFGVDIAPLVFKLIAATQG